MKCPCRRCRAQRKFGRQWDADKPARDATLARIRALSEEKAFAFSRALAATVIEEFARETEA